MPPLLIFRGIFPDVNILILLVLIFLAPLILRAYSLLPAALQRWRKVPQPPLAPKQLGELAWWQTWNIVLFSAFLVAFIAAIVVSWYRLLSLGATQILFAVYIGFGLGGLLHHFTVRCPRCGMNIGVQCSLALSACCERCQVVFRATGKA